MGGSDNISLEEEKNQCVNEGVGGRCARMGKSKGECGRVWKSVEECGRVWKSVER